MLARRLLARQRRPSAATTAAAKLLRGPTAWPRGLAGASLRLRRAYHHFTKEHGLAILRISSAAVDMTGAIEDAERGWEATGTSTKHTTYIRVMN